MKLSKETIAALPLIEDNGKADVIYFDDDLKGFGIRFRAGGKATWLIQYRDTAGNTRRNTIGDARKLEEREARKAAKTRLAAVTLGGDPQAEKEEARTRAKLTLGEQADRYLAGEQPNLRPNTFNGYKRYLTIQWKPLRGRPVHTITRRDVAARIGEIVQEHGPFSAARAKQTLSAFFAWLIREGIVDANPVIGTNNPVAGKDARDRVLTEDELRTVWNACQDDDFGRIIRLLMLTGARRDEIGGLRWSEVGLKTGVLRIPGSRTKNHHELTLTLPATALAIIESIPRREGRGFIFGGRGGAFSAWSYSMLALEKRIAEIGKPLPSWRIHDIRRSVATHMAELGTQPHIIEAILNHQGGHKAGVAGIYNRATYEREIKSALALWADHLRTIVTGEERTVIVLDSARRA
jgi:integrase